jgi:hypothetical protein
MGEMTNRLWLAAELQAGSIKHLSDDVDLMASEIVALKGRVAQLEGRADH